MPAKGPKPKSMPAWHPDRHVRRLIRGRIDLDPDLVPTFCAFLEMLSTRYMRERAILAGRSHDLDPAHYRGMIDRFDRLIDSISTLSLDLFKPHSGVSWIEAVETVVKQMEGGAPDLASKPARSSGKSQRRV